MWPIDLSEARVRNFVGRNSSKITGVLRRAMRDGLRRSWMARSGVPLIVTPVGWKYTLPPIRRRLSARPLKADASTVKKARYRKLFPCGKWSAARTRAEEKQ